MRKEIQMMPLNDTTPRSKGQHLSLSERIEIQEYKALGYSNWFIALKLGRSHGTINNEIKRGTTHQVQKVNGKKIYTQKYFAETGQARYQKHREACKPKLKIHKVQDFIQYAEDRMINDKWSPDAVVGYAKVNELFNEDSRVCTKTLYSYINACLMNVRNLDLCLKTRLNTKKQRSKQNKRCLGPSIEERPESINQREHISN